MSAFKQFCPDRRLTGYITCAQGNMPIFVDKPKIRRIIEFTTDGWLLGVPLIAPIDNFYPVVLERGLGIRALVACQFFAAFSAEQTGQQLTSVCKELRNRADFSI